MLISFTVKSRIVLIILFVIMFVTKSKSYFNILKNVGTKSIQNYLIRPFSSSQSSDNQIPGEKNLDIEVIDEEQFTPAPLVNYSHKNKIEPGHVYYVATPIGNLGDITDRARHVLSKVDVIFAEDTRQTIQLLKLLSIPYTKVISHHEHNQHNKMHEISAMAQSGKSIAVVSDAGTPGISDPGSPLAGLLGKKKVPVHPIPGPSAVIAAISIAGFSCTEFTFLGFLPVKGTERKEKIQQIAETNHIVVFYEAPHRILRTLKDLVENPYDLDLKSRPCVCCRELTKLHEEIKRDSLENIYAELVETEDIARKSGNSKGIKGEFTIVLGDQPSKKQLIKNMFKQELLQHNVLRSPIKASLNSLSSQTSHSPKQITEKAEDLLSEDETEPLSSSESLRSELTKSLIQLREDGALRSEAVKKVSKQYSLSKSKIYELALTIPWHKAEDTTIN